MKKISLVFGLVLLTIFGCEKNPVSKPSIKIQDLFGTWVSLDSSLVKNEKGEYVYLNDTILFTPDTFTCVNGKKTSPVLLMKFAEYTISIKEIDTLVLDYLGPLKIMGKSKHKIQIKEDTLTIHDISKLYPSHFFDKYKRIK